MGKFAVIDTETNWADQVMSIGSVIADAGTFDMIEAKYHILPIACQIGGMYESTLFIEMPVKPILCTRADAIADLRAWFRQYDVHSIFAYNACFDRNHLSELRDYDWYDIMRLAAYRQHNPKIPASLRHKSAKHKPTWAHIAIFSCTDNYLVGVCIIISNICSCHAKFVE